MLLRARTLYIVRKHQLWLAARAPSFDEGRGRVAAVARKRGGARRSWSLRSLYWELCEGAQDGIWHTRVRAAAT